MCMCMSVWCAGIFVHHVLAWYLQRSVEGIRALGTETTDCCEHQVGAGTKPMFSARAVKCSPPNPFIDRVSLYSPGQT